MFFKGAKKVVLPKDGGFTAAEFKDGSAVIHAVYNNDPSVTARVRVRYQSGDIESVNIPACEFHHALILEILTEGTSMGPAGLLAYR